MTVVKVVSDALDAEAKKWGDLKPVMDTAAKSVDDIILTSGAFFAGTDIVAPIVLLDVYNQLKNRVHQLSQEAATEWGQLEQALIRAKNEYHRVDGDSSKVMSVPVFGN